MKDQARLDKLVLALAKQGAKTNFPKFKGEIIISRFVFLIEPATTGFVFVCDENEDVLMCEVFNVSNSDKNVQLRTPTIIYATRLTADNKEYLVVDRRPVVPVVSALLPGPDFISSGWKNCSTSFLGSELDLSGLIRNDSYEAFETRLKEVWASEHKSHFNVFKLMKKEVEGQEPLVLHSSDLAFYGDQTAILSTNDLKTIIGLSGKNAKIFKRYFFHKTDSGVLITEVVVCMKDFTTIFSKKKSHFVPYKTKLIEPDNWMIIPKE